MDGPALDDIIFREIRVNELTTPAAENMAEVESGKSNLLGIYAARGRGDFATL